MTIISKGDYRLQTITQIAKEGCRELPIAEGLSIEKKCKNNNSYYVIMTIKWNCDGYCDIESSNSILDICDLEWKTVRTLISIGCQIVELANDEWERDYLDI